MPLPDEGLEAQMVKIYESQQKCLRTQEVLVALTFPFYFFGFIPLLLNFFVTLIWGNYLRNRASSLATSKYPGLGYRRGGNGFSCDPPIIDEAKRRHDTLTVRVLRFNYWSLLLVILSMLIYLFMLTWGSRFIGWQLQMALS